MAKDKKDYTVKIKEKTLVFKTTSYRVEKGSRLHSGIYNREIASTLVAGALLVAAAFLAVYLRLEVTRPHYAAVGALFVFLVPVLRIYVFYEDHLKAVMDKGRGRATVSIKGFMRRGMSVPMGELAGIRKGYTVIAEDLDAIRVAEKAALQDGRAMPGVGGIRKYYTVNLEFRDGETFILFSSEDPAQADGAHEALSKFIGGGIAP